ncbi:MAG: hypothetical protein KDA78_14690, partial [Planctomycetaceae bacterium]|nr:hypothetical protein [Planctomycetaceae bacterium]
MSDLIPRALRLLTTRSLNSRSKRIRRLFSPEPESCESRILLTTPIFINEFHYDDTGTDLNEFIEVAGPAGTDLDGFSIVLYDGSSGASYKTLNLTGTIPDQDDGIGTLSFLQEGILDTNGGFAFVDDNSNVLQFLSYEGAFTATDGPAQSLMSADIGLDEDPAVSEGLSLQLQGVGGCFEDFIWGLVSETPGAKNNGQNFYPCDPPAIITVTTAVDENNGTLDTALGTGTSLREAI